MKSEPCTVNGLIGPENARDIYRMGNQHRETTIVFAHEPNTTAYAPRGLQRPMALLRKPSAGNMKGNRIFRNIVIGIQDLMLHKLRSFLTMLGVVFGVGSVVAMLSVGEGASREALKQIRKLGSNNLIISAVKPARENSANAKRSRMSIYGLTYDDYLRIEETINTIKRSAPAKLIQRECRLGSRALELRVVGTTPEWFELVRRPIRAGRVLRQTDIDEHAGVAVLTEFGARKLLALENTVGQSLRIGGDYFEIIGIVKSESGQAGGIRIPDQEVDVYIPINMARIYFGEIIVRRTIGTRDREMVELHQIIAEVDRMEDVQATAEGIENMLQRFHKNKDYVVSVPLALLRQAEATKRTFNIVLGSIAGISLLVGGIGIINIMLATVTERTREIGIRRAIGAKRKQIISQFLIETLVLSTVGGFIGIGMGICIPAMITYFSGMPTIITPGSILLPLVISFGVGIVFGLYPAKRAASVDPIIALRHE